MDWLILKMRKRWWVSAECAKAFVWQIWASVPEGPGTAVIRTRSDVGYTVQ